MRRSRQPCWRERGGRRQIDALKKKIFWDSEIFIILGFPSTKTRRRSIGENKKRRRIQKRERGGTAFDEKRKTILMARQNRQESDSIRK